MCGVCGACFERSGRPVPRELVQDMCARIVHRGPDDSGFHVHGSVGLGMRRLSIIDIDTGGQPIFNEDRSICVVFNGEIYNFKTLRESLIQKGHRFTSQSDTEVIVHLYEDCGDDFVRQLNGMFAIALWDDRRRRLLLLRDRLGQKPLYYALTPDGLLFGSELKCLLQYDELSRELDHEAIYHYFTLGYIPNPRTIYRSIRQLPPAGRIVLDGNGVTSDQYWRLEPRVAASQDRRTVCRELRTLVSDAVRMRMISDVPLGAFLSGGLDSSIVVALMAQSSPTPVKTFHIDFSEPDYSERAYARAIASQYGTDHHELVVDPSAVEILDTIVSHFDEPFGDSSAIPTYYVSQITREHVTVALAGDGGDESFGGYERYQRILNRRNFPHAMRAGLGALGNTIHRCLPRHARGRRFFRSLGMDNFEHFAVGTCEMETRELLAPGFLETIADASTFATVQPHLERGDSADLLSPYTSLDIAHYLPDDILTKVDRMSMANSLELRAPFMDYRVVEFAAGLPCEWKISDGSTKRILKETFAPDLPSEVLKQRKQGFSLPFEHWLRNELRPVLEDAVYDSQIEASGIFRMREVRNLAEEHLSGVRDRADQLWRYLFFTRWWHQCQTANQSLPA